MNYNDYKNKLKNEYDIYKQTIKNKLKDFKDKQKIKLDNFKLNTKNKSKKRNNKRKIKGGLLNDNEIKILQDFLKELFDYLIKSNDNQNIDIYITKFININNLYTKELITVFLKIFTNYDSYEDYDKFYEIMTQILETDIYKNLYKEHITEKQLKLSIKDKLKQYIEQLKEEETLLNLNTNILKIIENMIIENYIESNFHKIVNTININIPLTSDIQKIIQKYDKNKINDIVNKNTPNYLQNYKKLTDKYIELLKESLPDNIENIKTQMELILGKKIDILTYNFLLDIDLQGRSINHKELLLIYIFISEIINIVLLYNPDNITGLITILEKNNNYNSLILLLKNKLKNIYDGNLDILQNLIEKCIKNYNITDTEIKNLISTFLLVELDRLLSN